MQIGFYKIGKNTKSVLRNEFIRLIPLIGISIIFLMHESVDSVIFLNLGIISAIIAISHLMRRLLFPYIDLEEFAIKAKESPIASAIIFASVSLLIGIILFSSFNLLS